MFGTAYLEYSFALAYYRKVYGIKIVPNNIRPRVPGTSSHIINNIGHGPLYDEDEEEEEEMCCTIS